jgi:hypothetical protein
MLKEILIHLPSTIKKIHFDFMNVEISKIFYMFLESPLEEITFIDFDEFFENVLDPRSREKIFETFKELIGLDLVKDFKQIEAVN